MLRVVTDSKELKKAFRLWKKMINSSSGANVRRTLTSREGRVECDLYWWSRRSLWCGLSFDENKGRIWCPIGTEIGTSDTNLHIGIQLNPPLDDVSKQGNGRIVCDSRGRYYVAHRGRLAGGANDVSANEFAKAYGKGARSEITWPDGTNSDWFVFGPVDSPVLLGHLAKFVSEAERIRKRKKRAKNSVKPIKKSVKSRPSKNTKVSSKRRPSPKKPPHHPETPGLRIVH